MNAPSRYPWTVMLATMAGSGWFLEGSSQAAAVGGYAPVSIWITGLIAVAWLLCVAILVFGVVRTLMGLTTYREEGMASGLLSGSAVIVGAVLAFFIIPPLVEAGLAMGATLR